MWNNFHIVTVYQCSPLMSDTLNENNLILQKLCLSEVVQFFFDLYSSILLQSSLDEQVNNSPKCKQRLKCSTKIGNLLFFYN